jgi:hypothetical protein
MGKPLRGRVGRHSNTGAQCQNWVEDQQTVIALLNLIPATDGGAEASLAGRVVAGMSSDALYKAILRFQKQYFPAQQSGFVEPNGAVLAKMETLASRPTPAPKATGQWGEFKSGTVQKALYEALVDEHSLNQAKVVEILRATLSNGSVTTSELDDLEMVAEKSRTIMPRSKQLLELFVEEARAKITSKGPYRLASSRHVNACDPVCDFLERTGHGQWPHLDRDEVGVGMLLRIAKPGLLQQAGASLCGPAAFLFSLLQDRPGQYARFAIEMYERGAAIMDNRSIEPSKNLRQSVPSGGVAPIDWLTMAGLRDSDNWWFNYDAADRTFSGATTQMEMAWWFTRAGYSDVTEDANLVRHQRDTDNMDEASRLVNAGYRVVLLIDEQMIETQTQSESGGISDRHWVVLRSTIDRSGGNVKMKIFTYGDGDYQVPKKGALPLDDFLTNYYGYVAARP